MYHMQNRRSSIEPSRTSAERSCQAGLLCLLLTAAWAAAGRDGVTGVFFKGLDEFNKGSIGFFF